MRTYLFWAMLRVKHEGKMIDGEVIEGDTGMTEFEARRKIVDRLLKKGAQIIRITPFQESIKGTP